MNSLLKIVASTFISLAFLTSAGTPSAEAQAVPELRVYFSPNGGSERAIIEQIQAAQKSIYIAMYSFTNPQIAEALLTAQKRGVKVYVKTDQRQSQGQSQKVVLSFLSQHNIQVTISKLSRTMHHKFAVIDETVLIFGSYNWTRNGESVNKENLIIWRHKGMARLYLDEFQRIE